MKNKTIIWFDKVATKVTHFSGSPKAFLAAMILIGIWAGAGPFFGWSDTHSLLINTVTTIITFLMVFIIQYSQNKDTKALHMKIDELIKASNARNDLMGIEKLSEIEIDKLKQDGNQL